MPDVATLGLKVDANGAISAISKTGASLKQLGTEGDKATASLGKLGNAQTRAERSTRSLAAAQKRAVDVQRQTAASDRGIIAILEARQQREIANASQGGTEVAKARVTAMEREFKLTMARLKEASARGLMKPAEAGREGRAAAIAYNQSVLRELSTGKATGAFSSPGGRENFTILAGSLKNVDAASRSASGGVGRLNLTMASLLSQATATHPAVGQLTQVVGSLAIGSGLMLGVLGGLAALALAYRNITKDAREAKEAQEEAFERLRTLQEQQRITDLGPGGRAVEDVQTARAEQRRIFDDIAAQKLLLAQLRAFEVQGLGEEGAVDAAEKELQDLRDDLAASAQIVESGEREITEKREEATARRLEIAEREAEERKRLEEEAQRPIDVSQAVVDNLVIQIDATERLLAAQKEGEEATIRVQAALDREQALRVALVNATDEQATEIEELVNTYRDLVDAIADEERAIEQAEAAYKAFLKIVAEGVKAREEAAKEAERAAKELIRDQREQIRDARDYAESVVQVAEAFGLLDDESARALESIIQVGAAIVRIATVGPDPSAIVSLAGGIVSLFGGGGPSEAEKEAERLQKENNRILEQNTRALERARDQLVTQGLTAADAQATIDAINAARAIRQPVRDEGGFTVGGGFTPFGRGFGDRGFTPTGGGSAPISFADALETAGLSMEEFARRARLVGIEILDAAGNLNDKAVTQATEALELWIKAMEQAEAALMDDLAVRRLSALGMDKEAAELRLQIQQEKELADARAAGFRDETIDAIELVQALERAAEARRDELAAIQALTDFNDRLLSGPLSPLSPAALLAKERKDYEDALALALTGDTDAAQRLPKEAQEFLDASRGFNASGTAFVADFNSVIGNNETIIDLYGETLSVNERMLKETKSQTEELKNIFGEAQASVRIQAEGFTQMVDRVESVAEVIEELIHVTQQGGEVIET